MSFDFKNATYAVNGRSGFDLSTALRLWKAKFETVKHFRRDVIIHAQLEDFGKFVEESWDDIQPVTVQEALSEKNIEIRSVYFDCIGPAKLFEALEPELLDTKKVKKKRTRWDGSNKDYVHEFEDSYELYRIDSKKLFPDLNSWQQPNPIYAVRCWCTTTNREYWIYVPRDVVGSNPDAIAAIAWTIRIDVTNPKRILRQGDIIIAETSEDSNIVQP